MVCTICSHKKTEVVRKVQSPLIDEHYQLYFCSGCESYFFNGDEWDCDIENYYNQTYHNLDENFKISRHWARQVKRILKQLPGEKQPFDILDVGCAVGTFLLHWDRYHHLFGVEINKNNAQIAQNKGITVYQNFIEHVQFDRQFDVITCYNLLEHLPNPGPVLEKISQILKKEGILVIEVPTIECKLYKKTK
jgi:2-polyprenyl-3-methyl-5-hydroxy-6-metoxy-1,4-benzoquinol methylase